MSDGKFIQGYYIPQNPKKYCGKEPPFSRSSWEYTFMKHCDLNPAIRKWASESIAIPYYDPTTNKDRKYYVDFFIENYKGERMLVEIKPNRETKKPRITNKKKKATLLYEQETYDRNRAKWEAAKAWCARKGMKFVIITEKSFNF